jgi:hypothetical protein
MVEHKNQSFALFVVKKFGIKLKYVEIVTKIKESFLIKVIVKNIKNYINKNIKKTIQNI